MSSHFSSRSAPANMPRSKAKQFLKRVLPRSIAILFATSALTVPVVIPAQVLVFDTTVNTSVDTVNTSVGTVNTSINTQLDAANTSLDKIITDINNETVTGTPVLPVTPTAVPTAIANVASYGEQACGLGAGALAEAALASIALDDMISPATISSPTGDPLGASAKAICVQIVAYRAQAYNDTVSEITALRQYILAAGTLQKQADTAITIGQSSALTAQSTSLLVELQSEIAYWETRKEAYQLAIKFLEDEQNTLTQTNLKGGGLSSLLAGGIQATALTGALAAITP